MNPKNPKMCAAIMALAAQLAAGTTQAAEAAPATWVAKEATFTYHGFTTKYTCDGLYDKVRNVVIKLGARTEDLKIRRTGCSSGSGRPDPFPGVSIKASVLQPASADDKAPVQAEWQTVELKANPNGVLDRGDCELAEQIKESVIPLFTTRNVQVTANCVPHQLSSSGMLLKLDVLMAKPEKVAK
jgi:hypothetical protein